MSTWIDGTHDCVSHQDHDPVAHNLFEMFSIFVSNILLNIMCLSCIFPVLFKWHLTQSSLDCWSCILKAPCFYCFWHGTPFPFSLTFLWIILPFRHEFKTNHEEWVKSVEPKLAPDVSDNVLAAINTTHENLKALYDIRRELRACIKILLKVPYLLARIFLLEYQLDGF